MKLPDTVTIATAVRLARREDLLIASGLFRFGQPFYLYSYKQKRFEGMYTLNVDHNSKEIEAWFRASMIFVPMQVLENNIQQLPETYLKTTPKSA